MRDPQRIVEEVQAFLMANDQTLNDRLAELAKEYKEACEEINKRLARCAQLLRQGLRAEAIHSAEAEPNLLTSLHTLDFPDRIAWLDAVGIFQLAAPPDFEHGIAEHLSAAYTEVDPHRQLLRKHRRLALARAPLRERLGVIRELARLDATNPIWDEDRRSYELARFKQIQNEAVEAARRKDAKIILALEAEVLNDPWAIRPTSSLVQAIKKAADTLRQESALRELPDVEARLNDAFSALDLGRARDERARWIALAESARLPQTHTLRERAEPALVWIDKEEEKARKYANYNQAVADLEAALDDSKSTADKLEPLHAALVRAERELVDPPGHQALTERYHRRIAHFASANSRKRVMAIGGSLAAALAIGVTAWLAFHALDEAGARQTAAQALDSAIAASQIDEVENLLLRYEQTRPSLLASTEVATRMPAVQKLREAETARKQTLANHLQEAENTPSNGKEPAGLEAARKLARTSDEKQSIEELAKKIELRDHELAGGLDRQLLPDLDAILKLVAAIQSDAGDVSVAPSDLSKRLTAARKRVDAMVPADGPVSATARQRIELVMDRLNAAQAEIDRLEKRAPTIERVTSAIRQLPEEPQVFLTAIKDRATAFAGDVREADIKRMMADPERSTWEAALAWSRQCREWQADAKRLNPDTSRQRLDYCRGHMKEYRLSPDTADVERYVAYLEPISKRAGAKESLGDRLQAVFTDPSIDPLFTIHTKSKPADAEWSSRHYCSANVSVAGSVSTLFRISSDGGTRLKTLSASLIHGNCDVSSQTKFAQAARQQIVLGDLDKDWDGTFVGWGKSIATYYDMDPICKLFLMRNLFEIGAEGSQSLREVLKPSIEELKSAEGLVRLEWLDGDLDLTKERQEAERLIAKLPKGLAGWQDAIMVAKTSDERLRKGALSPPRAIGWLERLQEGWRVRFSETESLTKVQSGAWELVVSIPEGKQAIWLPLGPLVGKVDGGVVLDRPEFGSDGRLIFARQSGGSRADAEGQGASR